MDRARYHLAHAAARKEASAAVWCAPDGWYVEIKPPTRSLDQNARLHAILSDISKSRVPVAGAAGRPVDELKFIFVVAHADATDTPVEVVTHEGMRIALRESTARMSVSRSASLIEHITEWALRHGIRLRDVPATLILPSEVDPK